MADRKLSALDAAATLEGDEIFYIVQDGVGRRVTLSEIQAAQPNVATRRTLGEGATVTHALCALPDGTLGLANASSASTMPALFFAKESGEIGEAISIGRPGDILDASGFVNTWVPGAPLYVTEGAGGIVETPPATPGAFVQLVGWAIDGSRMLWMPQVPTVVQ